MKFIITSLFVYFIFAAVIYSQTSERMENLKSLVYAEKSFAKVSQDVGIKDAFLKYLAESALVFNPEPVLGRPVYEKATNVPGKLVWMPVYADVSLAGDLGYTTGPYEFRPNGKPDNPVYYGHYFSLWRRQKDGNWKVEIDYGIQYGSKDTTISDLSFAENSNYKSMDSEEPDFIKETILKNDRNFSARSGEEGFANVFFDFSTPGCRVYRNGHFPTADRNEILKILDKENNKTWEPSAVSISKSGDLGYTYGYSKIKNMENDNTGVYLRVWRRVENNWKLVVDIEAQKSK